MNEHDPLARLRSVLPAGTPWRIAVIGAGSVGSQLAESLVRNGIRDLLVVDPDVVSAANLSRSVFRLADVGRPKAEALAEHLTAIAGEDLRVNLLVGDADAALRRPDELRRIDLLVLATDDLAAELRLNEFCYPAGIAMVSAKLFAGAAAVELAWVAPRLHSPCLRCLTAGRTGLLDRDTDYGSGRLAAEPALGPDIAVAAAQGSRTALSLLAAHDTVGEVRRSCPAMWFTHLARQGKVLAITANRPGWQFFGRLDDPLWADPWATLWIRVAANPQCLICGTNPGVIRRRPGDPQLDAGSAKG